MSSKRPSTNQNLSGRKLQTANVLPSLRKDLQNAKLVLQQKSTASGDSLYDHLSRIIGKVIDERPKDVVDYFEFFSENIRIKKCRMLEEEMRLEDAYKEPKRLEIAQQRLAVLIPQSQYTSVNVKKSETNEAGNVGGGTTESIANGNDEDDDEEDDEEEGDVIYDEATAAAVKDLCELQFYWNLFGIGFPREEVFSLSCALRQLRKKNATIATCRFWGKIFGLQSDYYIAECTLTQDALEKRIDAIEKTINIMNLEPSSGATSFNNSDRQQQQRTSSKVEFTIDVKKEEKEVMVKEEKEVSNSKNDGEDKYPAEWNFSMNIPETSYRPPIEIPSEDIGHGINRCLYYVCSGLNNGEWIELPLVTPHQINVSRRIKKYLTGNLDAEIASYPAFPGTERNYLRSLIARISAGTHVAPKKFFKFGTLNGNDEEEKEDESEDEFEDVCNNDKPIRVNASYRPFSLEKLLKLDYFVHIKAEILRQGRVCYFDGKSLLKSESASDMSSDVGEEDEETASTNNNKFITPEAPIPLFTSCSNDRWPSCDANTTSPWTIRMNDVVDNSPFVLLQSNIWPGAFSFVKDRICDNIYIGFGHKNSSLNHSPPAIPQMKTEDMSGVEGEEVLDASVEEEEDAVAAKMELSDMDGDKDSSDEVAN